MPGIPCIAITCGEPAGIGPDVTLAAALHPWDAQLLAIGDPALLDERAKRLGLDIAITGYSQLRAGRAHCPGELPVLPVQLGSACQPGRLDVANAPYVVETLHRAVDGCVAGEFAAMVTAPVQKSIINEAGMPFSGHTELLAERTHTPRVVMMLVAEQLRVALATTHLPLRQVPDAITAGLLEETLLILHRDLRDRFGIREPRIAVLGLNPHAGEGGHLGREELDIIIPTVQALQAKGLQLSGPHPADTAFNPKLLGESDAIFAMYHDQGLPVLKYAGFGNAINVTLGLPVIRTSVDHGTALDLAGSGKADPGSMVAALKLAIQLATNTPR